LKISTFKYETTFIQLVHKVLIIYYSICLRLGPEELAITQAVILY